MAIGGVGNIGVTMYCGYLVRRILSRRIQLWRGRDVDMNGVVGWRYGDFKSDERRLLYLDRVELKS